MNRRVLSIDLLRGLVIVLMAIDHVRDFWGPFTHQPEDLTQATPELFLTRWITHFCAPVFVFLAGTSAWLYGNHLACKQDLGASPTQIAKGPLTKFLLTRGLWLIALEFIIVNPSWTHGYSYGFVQVIWALGASMILLAGLIWLPRWAVLGISLLVVGGHNLLDAYKPADFGVAAPLFALLHYSSFIPIQPQGYGIYVAYPLLPWPALMALGYLIGQIYTDPGVDARRFMFRLGIGCIAAFAVLRGLIGYGDATTYASQPETQIGTVLGFLNTTKYPPSLQFLLMTIGPALCLLAWLRRYDGGEQQSAPPGWLANKLLVFGGVPMFFYLLHTPLISLSALLWTKLSYDVAINFPNTRPTQWPTNYDPSLLRVYLVWAVLLLLMYPLCLAYGRFKRRAKSPAWKLL